MTLKEEEEYRVSCDIWLKCSAELVEELKADAGFRMWLMGKTDAADHWKSFLYVNGGLLPRKLRSPQGSLGAGGKVRRKRK